MTRSNAKAPALGGVSGAIKSEPNFYEGNETMTSLSPRKSAHFETAIKVAGLTVAPGIMTGGAQPDETVVTLRTPDGVLSFSPAEACALAAALSSVGVHVMESTEVERSAA